MGSKRVSLVGGDGIGWALDEEIRLTRLAMPFARYTWLFRSEVVHSVYWPALLNLPKELLYGRRIIAHLTHSPEAAFNSPGFESAQRAVTLWIVRSKAAERAFRAAGIPTCLVNYVFSDSDFYCVAKQSADILRARMELGIPAGMYVIGSFQKDTETSDFASPKLVKGPDLFLETVVSAHQNTKRVHVLLAGPGRQWLLGQLQRAGVPFSYAGKVFNGNDLRINVLSKEKLNLLYNLTDLYLISSRSEGGPQAVGEAALAKCKVLSTHVGCAPDILHPDCLYESPAQATKLIEADMLDGCLAGTVEKNFESVQACLPARLVPAFERVYSELERLPRASRQSLAGFQSAMQMLAARLARLYQASARAFHRTKVKTTYTG